MDFLFLPKSFSEVNRRKIVEQRKSALERERKALEMCQLAKSSELNRPQSVGSSKSSILKVGAVGMEPHVASKTVEIVMPNLQEQESVIFVCRKLESCHQQINFFSMHQTRQQVSNRAIPVRRQSTIHKKIRK